MYLRTTGRRFTQMIAYFLVMNSKRCGIILYYLRRWSTPASTDQFTGIGQIFHNKCIFNNIKISKLILKMVWTRLASYPLQYGNWPWWNNPPICKESSARGECNWPISCLNDSVTKEKGVQGVKIRKIPGGACPRTSLETCAISSYPRSASVPHILTLVIILILIGFKRRPHARGRRFLSSHFTMCSSKFIILALWKSFK